MSFALFDIQKAREFYTTHLISCGRKGSIG